MYILSIRLTVFLLLFATISCDSSTDTVQNSSSTEHTNADLDMPEMPAYIGPVIDFRVSPEESATQFNWSVDFPYSGWKLEFAGAQTNPRTKHATIKLLITIPGQQEVVQNIGVSRTGEYRHDSQSFKSADIIVKLLTRGDESGDQVPYKRAASWSAKD